MSHLVSVVIPSFNHAQYISTAVESVLAQTYSHWELIIIDDGSKDNTEHVLAAYGGDPRIKVIINKENRGQSFVVNQALDIAQGDFVCFLPSDDWFTPGKLDLQVRKFNMSDKDVGVIYGRGQRFFEDTGKIIDVESPCYRGWVLRYLIEQPNFVYPITPLFRRSCFSDVRFDESYMAEGEAIYLKIAIKHKFDYVDEVVGVMRDHTYNTGKRVGMMYEDNLRYWNDFFLLPGLPVELLPLRKIPISRLHRVKGLEEIMLERHYAAGRKALISSICARPSLVFDYKVVAALLLSIIPSMCSDFLIDRFRLLAR